MSRLWRILGHSLRNWIFFKRNIFVFVEMLFWPGVGVLSLGWMADFLDIRPEPLSFVMTGAVAQGVLQVSQLEIVYGVVLYDFWSKSIKHAFLSPARPWEGMLGTWLTGVVRGLAVFGLLWWMGSAWFGFRLPGVGRTFLFLAGLFACSWIIAAWACSLILLFGQRAEISTWAISWLWILLCGIYYPAADLPDPFRSVATSLPLSHFLDFFRQPYGLSRGFGWSLVSAWLLWFLHALAAACLWRFALRRARRTGLLARLSE